MSCRSQRAEGSKSVRSVRSVCKIIFVLFVFKKISCEKNLVFKVPKAKSEIRVPKTSRKKAPCAKKIRVIRAIRVQKISCEKNLVFKSPCTKITYPSCFQSQVP